MLTMKEQDFIYFIEKKFQCSLVGHQKLLGVWQHSSIHMVDNDRASATIL